MGDAWMRLLPPVMHGKESAKTGLDKIAADVATLLGVDLVAVMSMERFTIGLIKRI